MEAPPVTLIRGRPSLATWYVWQPSVVPWPLRELRFHVQKACPEGRAALGEGGAHGGARRLRHGGFAGCGLLRWDHLVTQFPERRGFFAAPETSYHPQQSQISPASYSKPKTMSLTTARSERGRKDGGPGARRRSSRVITNRCHEFEGKV
jgi:hypothetical protein